jgi:hypothetical protein
MRQLSDEPWIERLPEALHRHLFPRGDADVTEFLAELDELEAAGFPMKCVDPETVLEVAEICRHQGDGPLP